MLQIDIPVERRREFPKKQEFSCRRKMNPITHYELWNSAEADRMSDFLILMAEDDSDDRFLMGKAMKELAICAGLRFVEDGEELMLYLRRSEKYADPSFSPRPALIIMDLNMPKKDGRQALIEIKTDPDLRKIPVVIWTTSGEREDKILCRTAGADDFVTKPTDYTQLVNSVRKLLTRYSIRGSVVVSGDS